MLEILIEGTNYFSDSEMEAIKKYLNIKDKQIRTLFEFNYKSLFLHLKLTEEVDGCRVFEIVSSKIDKSEKSRRLFIKNGAVQNLFISIDGLDGSGKTTLVEKLKSSKELGDLYFTREPGGTEFSEKIRNLVFESKISKDTELLMMFAARIEHLAKIKELLNSGYTVITDRYIGSSFMYQSECGYERIKTIMEFSNCLVPDMEILMFTNFEEYQNRKLNYSDNNKFDPSKESEFKKLESSLYQYCLYRNKLYQFDYSNKLPPTMLDTSNLSKEEILTEFLKKYHELI